MVKQTMDRETRALRRRNKKEFNGKDVASMQYGQTPIQTSTTESKSKTSASKSQEESSKYEKERLKRIEENRAILKQLGLDQKPVVRETLKPKATLEAKKKRRLIRQVRREIVPQRRSRRHQGEIS